METLEAKMRVNGDTVEIYRTEVGKYWMYFENGDWSVEGTIPELIEELVDVFGLSAFAKTAESAREDGMVRIEFEYRDAMSDWNWRKQSCYVRSVEECIKIYGLGKDCDYRILTVDGKPYNGKER